MSPRESQVLSVLAETQQDMTLHEIAARIDCTGKVVSSVIYKLRDAGRVVQVGHVPSSHGGRAYGLWRVADWRSHFKARPDVAAAWITREAA